MVLYIKFSSIIFDNDCPRATSIIGKKWLSCQATEKCNKVTSFHPENNSKKKIDALVMTSDKEIKLKGNQKKRDILNSDNNSGTHT